METNFLGCHLMPNHPDNKTNVFTHIMDMDISENVSKDKIGFVVVSSFVGTPNAINPAWSVITNSIATIRSNSMLEKRSLGLLFIMSFNLKVRRPPEWFSIQFILVVFVVIFVVFIAIVSLTKSVRHECFIRIKVKKDLP